MYILLETGSVQSLNSCDITVVENNDNSMFFPGKKILFDDITIFCDKEQQNYMLIM